MKCPKCSSENVQVQVVTEQVRKHHSILYWLLIGWWLEVFLWFFLTLPRLLIALFVHKPTKQVNKTFAVCQNCGNSWKV